MELTTQEKDALELFANDKILFPTVQKVIQARIENQIQNTVAMTILNFKQNMTNEEAGARLRACAEGIHLVEMVFADLSAQKKPLPRELKTNPAR